MRSKRLVIEQKMRQCQVQTKYQKRNTTHAINSARSNSSFLVELLAVLLPFHGQQLLFSVVAFFAAGHHIALGALAASGYGHDVIHGQIFGRERPAAVMANPFGQAAFPPLGFAQRSGLVTLPFLVVCAKIIGIGLDGGFFFHGLFYIFGGHGGPPYSSF